MIKIDLEQGVVTVESRAGTVSYGIGTPEAFAAISNAWLRSGWDNKYVYGFSWMGRPIIQLPEDMIRIQEVIYQLHPDVIVETGVAHGGSLVFYASLCKAMGKGRVIGIDVEIRPHNRKALEAHELFPLITLIEGSSVDSAVVRRVGSLIKSNEKVLVILDSNHTKEHVLSELRAYSDFVTEGSYIVATDGIMENLVGAPRSNPDWCWNNPKRAAEKFVSQNPKFQIHEPSFPFNEGTINQRITYWPSAWIKKISA